MPGLRRYQVSDGPVGLPGIHLVALLEFDSAEAIQNAVASPKGRRLRATSPIPPTAAST